jgi:hypothetical protein
MASAIPNPFQITSPVAASEVIDRTEEAAQLCSLAEEANSARVVAPRRYGKTSLLKKVQKQLEDDGWITVYVDLSGIVTTSDFADRLELAYTAALKGPLAKWFAARRRSLKPRAKLGGGPVPAAITADLSGVPQSLLTLLDMPLTIAEKGDGRVHVVFDEFQEVLSVGPAIDQVVRGQIQHHGSRVSYVFAGSQITMMEKLFTDRNRAFFGQAMKVDLNPLSDEALGAYIVDRFERTGRDLDAEALGALLDSVAGHPQRAMLAAHELWKNAESGTADLEAWWRAYESVMVNVRDEAKTLWRELKTTEKKALQKIAAGAAPYATKDGSSQRGKSVKLALDSLEDRGLISGEGRHRRVVDPFFREWITPTVDVTDLS